MTGFVRIDGEGVAARSAAHLLGAQQLPAVGARPSLSAILLSTATQSLLTDVFNDLHLFTGLHQIRRRIVAWGQNEPVELEHAAVVVSEQVLLDRLQSSGAAVEQTKWRIVASKHQHPFPMEEQFGTRLATITPAQLNRNSPNDACWIESVQGGWLFLLALGDTNASLISVGARPQSMLERSRLVAPHIVNLETGSVEVPAYPRIHSALCGPGWFACGSAAMSFDPVCGEGAGHAVREAILASAAVKALLRGEPEGPLLAHYSTRLTSAFLRHLETCYAFYSVARSGPWWDREIALLEQGIAWCRVGLANAPRYLYRLEGFELVPLETTIPGT